MDFEPQNGHVSPFLPDWRLQSINGEIGEIEYKLKKQDEKNYIWSDEQAHEPILTKEK